LLHCYGCVLGVEKGWINRIRLVNVKLLSTATSLVIADLNLPLLDTYSEKANHSKKIAKYFISLPFQLGKSFSKDNLK
jgi:hypothetical protein